MKKTLIIIGTIIIILVIGFYSLNSYIYKTKQGDVGLQIDYKNATYFINNHSVTLVDGYSEKSIEDSASKVVTRYFGNEATGDLNGDGISDIAFLLTQNSGGGGTFYYVVSAVKTDAGYVGTNAVLLGDRVAPQTNEIKNGQIIVNYADRRKHEPMATQPSVGVSRYFKISDGELVEVKK